MSPKRRSLNPLATDFVMPSPAPKPAQSYSRHSLMTWSQAGVAEVDKLTRIEENIDSADAKIQAFRDKGDLMTRAEKRQMMIIKNARKGLRHARSRLLANIIKSGKGGRRKTKKTNNSKTKKTHKKSRRH
jgi:hypothetical protein